MSLILNKAQAEAIYSAMCALNNVNARCNDLVIDGGLSVWENTNGTVVVLDGDNVERYTNQAEFATAYGVN